MLQIHLTGIAKVRQLNCAKGKASTLSAIHHSDTSPDILILLLQDPWITSNRQSPHTVNYHMLLPTSDHPKCATYITKHLYLSPGIFHTHLNCILSVGITINKTTHKFTNIYSRNKKAANAFLTSHLPLANALVAGDFNANHNAQYG